MSASTDPNTDIPFTPSSAAAGLTPPTNPPGALATLSTIARRSGYKMLRTPQIAGIAVVQSLVFLFMFR